MKQLFALIACAGLLSSYSQNVKINFVGTGAKPDFYFGVGTSRVINNTIYTHSESGRKVTVTGFDAATLKQTISFKAENTMGFSTNDAMLYLENKLLVLHESKREDSEIYGNIYSYDGKLLHEDKLLHKFASLDKDGDRSPYDKDIVSENGKFFGLFSFPQPGELEYALYDSDIKLLGKGIVKFPREYVTSRVFELTLSNTGNIGVFVYTEGDKCSFNLLRIRKGERAAELVKSLSSGYMPHKDQVISTASAIYVGGYYGNQKTVKDITLFGGTTTENTVYGAFSIKTDHDINVVYDRLTEFSAEQVKAYNTEFEKFASFKGVVENYGYSKDRIYNISYAWLRMDGISLDEGDNMTFALSTYNARQNGNIMIETSMIICQFKLIASGMSNFKIIPKRQQTYGSNGNSSCFLSSIVCSGDNLISIFNDDEDNLDNLNDMNENVTKGSKKAWLVCAETKSNGSFKKIALLPEHKDILILPETFKFVSHTLSFALGLKDNGEIILLKISTN